MRVPSFLILLPVVRDQRDTEQLRLPKHSRELISVKHEKLEETKSEDESAEEIRYLQGLLADYLRTVDRRLAVLLVDDDEAYLEYVMRKLRSLEQVAPFMDVVFAKNSEQALKLVERVTPTLILCDVNLGPASLSGFELISWFKRKRPKAKVCIHTNRILPGDPQKALSNGADFFLPKPISRVLLLKTLLGALEVRVEVAQVPTLSA